MLLVLVSYLFLLSMADRLRGAARAFTLPCPHVEPRLDHPLATYRLLGIDAA